MRKVGHETLGKAMGVEVQGSHPTGRPRNTIRQCVEEDVAALVTEEAEAMCRDSWKSIIDPQTS